MYRVGIDLGGTKIEGVLISPEGKILIRKRIPTQKERGYYHILNSIANLIAELTQNIRGEYTIGIGTPGSLSPKTGLMRNSNTLCLNGKPLKKDLEELLNKEIKMENDANCFAVAETLKGAAQGKKLVFGVIMGTGCGGGIVIDGKVWTGFNRIGGEWGHSILYPAGRKCYCGKCGCVENYISGGGVEKIYLELSGKRLSFYEISKLYGKDEIATHVIENFLDDFGKALSNVINILDPEIVVLGGGVSNFPLLYTEGVKRVSRYIFSDTFSTPIVKNQLGDSAGVVGAAYL